MPGNTFRAWNWQERSSDCIAKRIFIIHGWGGNSQSIWIPWLKGELEKKGFEVHALDMPDTEHPRMETWVPYLAEKVGDPDEETFLVGHSMGCQTIIRYLGGIDKRIGGIVLVAGFVNIKEESLVSSEEKRIMAPWTGTPIDWQKIRSNVKRSVFVLSDNDPYIEVSNAEIFREKLGAKTLIIPKAGHFTAGYTELHLALNELMKMLQA